jgi:threonine dehydrogenase-like Zn-dependent dehydrogenase
MGIVESVGSNVKNIKVGDRVVVSAPIACGQCECKSVEFTSINTYPHISVILILRIDCKTGMFSLCDVTNDSKVMETLYGHRICGAFGYSHLTGSV